jgi:hypothetical protein
MVMEAFPEPPPGAVFVFGSNRAGRHGRGAAWTAYKKHGALYGKGEGFQGQSYGIPTKDEDVKTLPLGEIEWHVIRFIQFAAQNPDKTFFVTRIGCGLAGYFDDEIAPLFRDAPSNCLLPPGWR